MYNFYMYNFYMYISRFHNLKWTLQQTGEISCVVKILLPLMYNRMVLVVVCWRYGMPSDANGFVYTLINVTFCANTLVESSKSVNECRFNKMNVFSR